MAIMNKQAFLYPNITTVDNKSGDTILTPCANLETPDYEGHGSVHGVHTAPRERFGGMGRQK
jgi:hypothetical protein